MRSAQHKKYFQTGKLRLLWASLVITAVASAGMLLFPAPRAAAAPLTGVTTVAAGYWCGAGKNATQTSIDLGCMGTACKNGGAGANNKYCQKDRSALMDLLFAILRFLSAGVGIVVVASIIVAGIQYSLSRGDPQKAAEAIKRVTNTLVALAIYIFAYAILNYLIPSGFFS